VLPRQAEDGTAKKTGSPRRGETDGITSKSFDSQTPKPAVKNHRRASAASLDKTDACHINNGDQLIRANGYIAGRAAGRAAHA